MGNFSDRTDPLGNNHRRWESADEFLREVRAFSEAAQRFIGRGESQETWNETQKLRLKLAHVIENSDTSEWWRKRLTQMLKSAEPRVDSDYRRLAVQTVQTWGDIWKLPQWQATADMRRLCLARLVAALEVFDPAFGILKNDLGNLGAKLDRYVSWLSAEAQYGPERLLAELVVEGTDALGFVVEPSEPMQAEVCRIERELRREVVAWYQNPERKSARMRKAAVVDPEDNGSSSSNG